MFFLLPTKPTFQEQVANGWLADLTQFSDWNEFKKTFPDPAQNFAEGTNTVKGKTYSAPHEAPFGAMWYQLYVNTKVLKDAGLVDASGNPKLPVTADDLISESQTIKTKSGGKVYGWGWGGKSDFVWGFPLLAAQLSGANPDKDGLDFKTGKYDWGTNPAYKNALETMVKMRDTGLILPESASIDDEGARAEFADGKFAFLIAGTWVINGWAKTHPNFADYTITAPPLFGTAAPKSYYNASPGGTLFGVNAKSKRLEAAWKFFKFLESKDAGVRWVKSNNGFSIFPDANKPENITNIALKNYATIAPTLVRYTPQLGLHNPDTSLVKIPDVKPGSGQIVQGVFTGQIKDIGGALTELGNAKQKALEQAINDAKAAGAKVSTDDYKFSDWDPAKDYVTTAAK